jgi:hypothetical protein
MRAATVLVAFALGTASCGPGAPLPAATAPGAAAPSTWPLRGTPVDGGDPERRPIVVKVANDAAARPQSGLAAADLVLELPVEGGITRYALVFHSQEPVRVGPVRSARRSDIEEASTLKAILVHVGASEAVARAVRDAAKRGAFIDVDEFEHAGAFERVRERPVPHNAYTSGAKVRSAAGSGGRDRVEVPAFAFRGTVRDGGAPGTSLVLPYGDPPDVRYEYDAGKGAYRRLQGGRPTADDGAEVLPQNVVVIRTDVREVSGTADVAGAPSVEHRATGTGPVVVLRDGARFEGTWSRRGGDTYRFADASGKEIGLKPGLTWIHIVPMDVKVT